MSYQVIARRWRPQKLDDVVGQRAVTQTLRNAISSGRIAQAFVFAGPRGVGKTTTARILARMLNCVDGPTPDPCGDCEPCREIAEGRDMDVLEIDAATHTGIDNVREVIITGLGIMPARNRYKIFIIDEVHQLSSSSFNALLKSIEEPPPHVAFIMATTAPDKIPDTIISRAQYFEFKAISSLAIADQLKKIAMADTIDASGDAIALMARAAEGSMRDAETAFDQVIAFAGTTVTVEDVATVLGLVGRDLLFDVLTAVADENGSAAFELAGRAVEAGYDLRLLCKELARLVRDLLVLAIDPSRMSDANVAPEGDRARLAQLGPRFSREDLLRAFDVLTRAEFEIKGAAEPRYHLEMALLRWIHLRKLTPLSELIERLEGGSPLPAPAARTAGATGSSGRQAAPLPLAALPAPPAPAASAPPPPARPSSGSSASVARRVSGQPARQAAPASTAVPQPAARVPIARPPAGPDSDPAPAPPAPPAGAGGSAKEAFLRGIQQSRAALYGTVVAQAQRIEFEQDRIVFRFSQVHGFAVDQVAQNKAWLEDIARQAAGRPMSVVAEIVKGDAPARRAAAAPRPAGEPEAAAALKAEAMADPAVQALLEIFPADIKDVSELKKP